MKQPRRGLNAIGLGAAACAACCAGPILAYLGGIGVLGVFSTFVIGWIGELVVAATIAAFVIVRRRRVACEQPATTVAIPIPSRRTPQTTEAR